MPDSFADQRLKPINAAKRLGILLTAAPADFQANPITRRELSELTQNPPQWLTELRKNGPHPRNVVAGRLGISISGLARADIKEPLTTAQIDELRANPPAWLVKERETARDSAGIGVESANLAE